MLLRDWKNVLLVNFRYSLFHVKLWRTEVFIDVKVGRFVSALQELPAKLIV